MPEFETTTLEIEDEAEISDAEIEQIIAPLPEALLQVKEIAEDEEEIREIASDIIGLRQQLQTVTESEAETINQDINDLMEFIRDIRQLQVEIAQNEGLITEEKAVEIMASVGRGEQDKKPVEEVETESGRILHGFRVRIAQVFNGIKPGEYILVPASGETGGADLYDAGKKKKGGPAGFIGWLEIISRGIRI